MQISCKRSRPQAKCPRMAAGGKWGAPLLLILTFPYASTSKDFHREKPAAFPLVPSFSVGLSKRQATMEGPLQEVVSHSAGRHHGHLGHLGVTREEDSRHRPSDSVQRPHSIEKDSETLERCGEFPHHTARNFITGIESTGA